MRARSRWISRSWWRRSSTCPDATTPTRRELTMIDKEWAIVELMGHRKLAGYCTDDGGMLRIDVYDQEPSPKCETCSGRGGWTEDDDAGAPQPICCPDCDGDGTRTVRPL